MDKKSVYEIITDRIIDKLKSGVIPWQKPWSGDYTPVNIASHKPYRGINVLLLNSMGFSSPYWLTFKQAAEISGNVRKGEKGTPVIFWKWLQKKDEDQASEEEITKQIPFLRYYTVFNIDQCENLPESARPKTETPTIDFNPIEKCEQIVADMPNRPKIDHIQQRACYYPGEDRVNMPKPETFMNEPAYYATLFHELTHSTSHPSRLARRKTVEEYRPFGSQSYSKEELIAEMGASFLCGEAHIENATIDNSTAYVQSWLEILHNDKKMVIIAAAQAQKAAEYILGKKNEHV
uniref:DUF1738 domain-containing protein n=1 Tax=viral metagenome TaxID=1070528 RepID=A0A6M3LJW1_9ZZZZ